MGKELEGYHYKYGAKIGVLATDTRESLQVLLVMIERLDETTNAVNICVKIMSDWMGKNFKIPFNATRAFFYLPN